MHRPQSWGLNTPLVPRVSRRRDQTIFDVGTKSFSTEKRVLPDLVSFLLGVINDQWSLLMSIIYVFEVAYICRLLPEGGTILNEYTPISFG